MSESLAAPWRIEVLLAANPNEERLLRAHLALARPGIFRVSAVPNLNDAVAELRRRPYDLLLVSLHPSDPSGAEVLLKIRGLAYRIPAVVVAWGADEETALKAVEAGVQEVLDPDTLRPETLGRTLRHAIARHRLLVELRRAQQASGSQTFFDSVTGLATRGAFIHRLEETVSLAQRFGEHPVVLFVGLDGLSQVSESLGPLLTARVLQETGRRLLWCVRRSDLTARLGGGRFAVLLPNVPNFQAVNAVAERIRLTLAEPMENHSRRPQLTASLGLSCYPHDGETAEALLQQAEVALARARAKGGNCSRFSRNLVLLLRPEAGAIPAPALADRPQAAGAR
ncbi:MAG TPA: GGDEF domain-containing response regulator [Thermoanaerobaculia bacterium]|nr:GGDEF domain-containing response regulator [Thermoanaerobaculia bacterium]